MVRHPICFTLSEKRFFFHTEGFSFTQKVFSFTQKVFSFTQRRGEILSSEREFSHTEGTEVMRFSRRRLFFHAEARRNFEF